MDLARFALEEAGRLGFHRTGIAPASGETPRHEAYRRWVAAGHAGGMAYLARPEAIEARRRLGTLLPGAESAVVVALSYGGPDLPAPGGEGPRGFVARYAHGADYHGVVRERLARLAARLAEAAGRPVASRVCCDTAPVLERALAEAAGLGFVGKNTLLIVPGLGSYTVLGVLLTDLALVASAKTVRTRCGACRACLDACPTAAFPDAYVLDARRCVSTLTIELPGPIPAELRPGVGARLFGCDVCQEVCPFNAAVSADATGPRAPDPALRGAPGPDLLPLARLGASAYRRLVAGTALRRVHRAQLARNACVALGNAGDPSARPALRAALADRSPLVRAHAAWALGRLGDREALLARRDEEPDESVRAEIDAALI